MSAPAAVDRSIALDGPGAVFCRVCQAPVFRYLARHIGRQSTWHEVVVRPSAESSHGVAVRVGRNASLTGWCRCGRWHVPARELHGIASLRDAFAPAPVRGKPYLRRRAK